MPTGTGKTETMISLLVARKCEKLLITVPTDPLREQIAEKFIGLGLLKKFGIIGEQCSYPIVGIIQEKFKDIEDLKLFIDKCNVIIATMKIVSESDVEYQNELASTCSHLFIDEAHHVKAPLWQDFRNRFASHKVVQFTATPFRNDGQRLDGEIIYNYPLKKAQSEGYYRKIRYFPVTEYIPEEADQKIADKAVDILRNDISKGYNHILMARCRDISRAQVVYKCYEKFTEFNPVQIHTKLSAADRREIRRIIVERKTRIIVCVDMLGEGFDLPELKIAAFHDIKKSLPVTLQLAGRFTRTKYDEELGEAAFVVNIVEIDAKEEIEDLYAQDANWNYLLPQISTNYIRNEIDFSKLYNGFHNFDRSKISLQNIRPALSAVIYNATSKTWYPGKFLEAFQCKDDIVFHDINFEMNILIIIYTNKTNVEWGIFKDINNLQWDIIIAHFEEDSKLLFIHGSDKDTLYSELANTLLGEKASRIEKLDVYKAFHNINRVQLQNVGLREYLGRNVRFRMMVGTDVESALSIAEKQKAEKAFVYGVGYENGLKTTLGCSYKGRIWSRQNGDLKDFKDWCKKIAKKVTNKDIDPNQLLRETLLPALVTSFPADCSAVWVDWNDEIYNFSETKISIEYRESSYPLYCCELSVGNVVSQRLYEFLLNINDAFSISLGMELYEDQDGNPNYKIEILSKITGKVYVKFGRKTYGISEFFNEYVPVFWFADGSSITGNEYVKLKQSILPYPKDKMLSWDWTGIDLHKESQGIEPKIVDSIQYRVIQELRKNKYDIIYDDDYSGEIADIITIKQLEDKIKIELYHLKFALGGVVGNSIKNLYEVCGQAQKSVKWKFKDNKEIFDHMLRRRIKSKNSISCSRFEYGNEETLRRILHLAKRKFPVEYEVFIVQPGMSIKSATDEQLVLIAVTENYIKEISAINLSIIASQ